MLISLIFSLCPMRFAPLQLKIWQVLHFDDQYDHNSIYRNYWAKIFKECVKSLSFWWMIDDRWHKRRFFTSYQSDVTTYCKVLSFIAVWIRWKHQILKVHQNLHFCSVYRPSYRYLRILDIRIPRIFQYHRKIIGISSDSAFLKMLGFIVSLTEEEEEKYLFYLNRLKKGGHFTGENPVKSRFSESETGL